jgi:putative transposase
VASPSPLNIMGLPIKIKGDTTMKGKKGRPKKQERISIVEEKSVQEEVRDSLLEQVILMGIECYTELITDEITQICGERYKHMTGREFTRWSKTETSVVLGGKKISLSHPRIRNIKDNSEKEISTISSLKDQEILSKRQAEQMILGVSTRKCKRSLEADIPGIKTKSHSKSSVSRNFIAMTQARLEAWRNEPIEKIYPFLMIDGTVFQDTTVLVALGFDENGKKKTLGAWEGSTENTRSCTDLLNNLIERGLNPETVKMATIDGSKALRKALKDVFGTDLLVQRCQVHKKKNVADYLPKEKRETITRAMSEAYNAEKYDVAKRLLNNLINKLNKDYPQAARSLEEGLEETLTLHKLKAHMEIRKSLGTTNPIESLNSGIKNITRRVKRWRNSNMVIRWVGTAIMESEKNFRKINGYRHIDALIKNIESYNEHKNNNFQEKVLDKKIGAA